jgi:hypothetical protein
MELKIRVNFDHISKGPPNLSPTTLVTVDLERPPRLRPTGWMDPAGPLDVLEQSETGHG